jgi:hypothetical protein
MAKLNIEVKQTTVDRSNSQSNEKLTADEVNLIVAAINELDILIDTEEPPAEPSGFVWIRKPVLTLSGTNNETINVTEDESQLNRDTPIIYPTATFTRTLPDSPNIRLNAVEAKKNSTYGIVSSAEGLT